MEKPVKISVILKGEEIFEKWIPGKVYQVNNSVAFSGIPTEPEEFLRLQNKKG